MVQVLLPQLVRNHKYNEQLRKRRFAGSELLRTVATQGIVLHRSCLEVGSRRVALTEIEISSAMDVAGIGESALNPRVPYSDL